MGVYAVPRLPCHSSVCCGIQYYLSHKNESLYTGTDLYTTLRVYQKTPSGRKQKIKVKFSLSLSVDFVKSANWDVGDERSIIKW